MLLYKQQVPGGRWPCECSSCINTHTHTFTFPIGDVKETCLLNFCSPLNRVTFSSSSSFLAFYSWLATLYFASASGTIFFLLSPPLTTHNKTVQATNAVACEFFALLALIFGFYFHLKKDDQHAKITSSCTLRVEQVSLSLSLSLFWWCLEHG